MYTVIYRDSDCEIVFDTEDIERAKSQYAMWKKLCKHTNGLVYWTTSDSKSHNAIVI